MIDSNYPKKKWSLKSECCVKCRTKSRPHKGKGLCARCYNKENQKQYITPKGRRREKYREKPTREVLLQSYITEEKSIGDIAQEFNYSRARISQFLKEYGIKTRSLSQARKHAMDKGKIKIERIDEQGEVTNITVHRNTYNPNFFKNWTPEMAYVLGLLITDGNITLTKQKNMQGEPTLPLGRITFGQNHPELLEKILILMDASSRILYRKKRECRSTTAGEMYYFHLNSNELYKDLLSYGLHPNKSRTIRFPEVPENCLRHFIRGCWDGDGSFYIEKKRNKIRGDFVSGSYNFIKRLVTVLYNRGFVTKGYKSRITIHKKTNTPKNTYYIKLSHQHCIKLYHYLYDDVPSSMYLSRKKKVIDDYLQNNH